MLSRDLARSPLQIWRLASPCVFLADERLARASVFAAAQLERPGLARSSLRMVRRRREARGRAGARTTTSEKHMPAVKIPPHKSGDILVDYEEKVFEDVKAQPGEKA